VKNVLRASEIPGAPASAMGGKAVGLARLLDAGCSVPRFFVLTTAAFRAGLTDDVRSELRHALSELGPVRVAVRSSATVEDGAGASWAGQFETILGALGAEEVEAAVLRCWASLGSERVAAYAERHGAPGAMAVIVQELIEGEVSGVLFSRDPDDPDRALISAGLGLGEGVVQGLVPCDTWRVDAADRIEAALDVKDEEVILGDAGPMARPVTDSRRDAACLGDAQLLELTRSGRALERRLGSAVDVEFTVRGGALVLLQVRPIAVPLPRGRRLLWDNSNIVESYSGMTTPLTFSFASRAYTIVYQLFCRVMGVDEEVIRANEPVYRRMIGLVRGRIYYNLNAWYRVLSLLPGFSFNRGAMEAMMGVSEVASDEDAGATGPRWVEGIRLARLTLRLGWRLLRLEADAARFQEHFRATLARVKRLDLDAMRADELLSLYEDVERELLWAWTPPLVNDFFCMIFFRLLQKSCQELTGDPATTLHHRLLAGEGSLASAAPAVAIGDLAARFLAEPEIAALLGSDRSDPDVLPLLLAHETFRSGFDAWMEAYGDRSPDELKLERPTLADTPEFVVGAIRAAARQPRRARNEDHGSRDDAEREALRLAGSGPRGLRFRWILRQARRRVALRESLRFERTRIFGFVRRLFRAFGHRFVEAGALDAREDVHWLTVDEILGFVRGTTASADLRGLAALREAEHARWEAAEPPAERFHTWGAVHVHNRFRGRARPVPTKGDALQGTACSPGLVTAKARVITDPREAPDLGGALLVAHRTDPGWVPLFPTASGVLVERGSLLSHSAVVARELGLPAIVGLRGLLAWARDGEELTMDGSTGVVRRAEAAKEAAGG
jgi:phosphohistidine swiveling domain-containing protein